MVSMKDCFEKVHLKICRRQKQNYIFSSSAEYFFENSFRNTISVSNGLVPDQA